MGAMKELIILGIVLLLSVIGAAYIIPKASSKQLNQHIVKDMETVNMLRNAAQEYAGLTTNGDFTGINIEAIKNKNILPSNANIEGTGDTSVYHPPYDPKEKISMYDPNKGDPLKEGTTYTIEISAADSKMDNQSKEIWEKKLEENFKRSGGQINTFGSYTDGKIAVTFE